MQKSASQRKTELQNGFVPTLTPEQRNVYLKIETLEGQCAIDDSHNYHNRLKATLPRCYWPLLAVAFSTDPETWSQFERETTNSWPEYV